jgi:hypothetical protein
MGAPHTHTRVGDPTLLCADTDSDSDPDTENICVHLMCISWICFLVVIMLRCEIFGYVMLSLYEFWI